MSFSRPLFPIYFLLYRFYCLLLLFISDSLTSYPLSVLISHRSFCNPLSVKRKPDSHLFTSILDSFWSRLSLTHYIHPFSLPLIGLFPLQFPAIRLRRGPRAAAPALEGETEGVIYLPALSSSSIMFSLVYSPKPIFWTLFGGFHPGSRRRCRR